MLLRVPALSPEQNEFIYICMRKGACQVHRTALLSENVLEKNTLCQHFHLLKFSVAMDFVFCHKKKK
jgi:hypothetical protein